MEMKKPYINHRRANSQGIDRRTKKDLEGSLISPWDISEQLDISKL